MRRIPPGLAPVLFIPGLMFEALLRARSGFYAASLFRQRRLPAPVISIGNITMGGTGKTPLVLYVARTLAKIGLCPAILSRGYGRIEPDASHILSPGEAVASPARTLGDEPAMIRRHLPSAFMGISKNRFWAGSRIVQRQKQIVFVLDDGFQHRRLHRDLDIVIVDCSQPLGSNRVFPRGTLREPLSELRRCHVAMIHGVPGGEEADSAVKEIRLHQPKIIMFHCKQTVRSLIPFSIWQEDADSAMHSIPVRSAFPVGALGNPERFERDIRKLGVVVSGAKYFPDHYWLKPNDWMECAEEARRKGADAIILTEKDAVKITRPPDYPLLVAVQSTEVFDAKEFERILRDCAEERL
jgi:tetraacyldisaccharide 4'-kinase